MPLIATGLAKSGVLLEIEASAAWTDTLLDTGAEVKSVDVARRLFLAGTGLTVHFAAVVHEDIQRKRLPAVPIGDQYLNCKIARATGLPPSRATEAVTAVLREVVEGEIKSRPLAIRDVDGGVLTFAGNSRWRAEGAKLGDEAPQEILDGFHRAPPDLGTSILANREAHRPLEWDCRNGVVQRRGRARRIPTPISDLVVPLLAAASDGPG